MEASKCIAVTAGGGGRGDIEMGSSAVVAGDASAGELGC